MVLCRGFRNSGIPCTYDAKKGDLCKLHFNSKANCPIEWERKQIRLKIKGMHREIDSLNMSPDTEADIKYFEIQKLKTEQRLERERERFHWRNNRYVYNGHDGYDDEDDDYYYDNVIPAAGAPAPLLVAFHADNQNVHRAETVSFVKDSVSKIAAIVIDDPDFVWNTLRVSKTPGEIIIKCSLTPSAAVLLIQKYAAADTIYDMMPGIYGKVLDGVLQFIKTSEDSVNLYKILKIELEDNVEMCAQGNLSRLCNVLGGYLEGISTSSVVEILGNLLPPLASIADLATRYTAAVEIMKTYSVPEEKWEEWFEPLDITKADVIALSIAGVL